MPRTEKYTCDVCGAEKKETNHWMLVAHTSFGIEIGPFSERRYFEEAHGDIDYLCGEKCVTTTAARWAAAQKGSPE